MHDTYTYTARSADEPEELATFTLYDHSLSVEAGDMLMEQIDRLLDSGTAETQFELSPWLKPAIVWLAQELLRPFSVADVTARTQDEGFWITGWLRVRGMRLAPLTIGWNHVDNPDAAKAFEQELNKRKVSAPHPGRFPGPFDYWAAWIIVVMLVALVPLRWMERSASRR
jgi:hypothetical protein